MKHILLVLGLCAIINSSKELLQTGKGLTIKILDSRFVYSEHTISDRHFFLNKQCNMIKEWVSSKDPIGLIREHIPSALKTWL